MTALSRAGDLRMPALGAAAWAGGLGALAVPSWVVIAGALVTAVLALTAPPAVRRAVLAWLLLALVVGTSAHLRDLGVARSPVAALAETRTAGRASLTVTSDPRPLQRQYDGGVMLRATVTRLSARQETYAVHAPVLVLGGEPWSAAELGSVVAADIRLASSDGHDLAAVVVARGSPVEVRPAGPLWRAAGRVRQEIRDAVGGVATPGQALVPALVVGDDAGLGEQVQADFRTTGLTHLLAVSGTNLTLVVGFLVVVGRWCGVRGRWQLLLGAAGIAGFVLLARTEPSVVRAAAMGTVALIGMGSNGRDRGARSLGVAVAVLLLWDPWLAVSVGFALSVLATAGILFLAPRWRDAMSRWMPGWLAAAVAVPAAAQLACTPVVAAISGEVSLVAVAANMLAAPLVAPATVCGLLGGLVGLVLDPGGRVLGTVAVVSGTGIVEIAGWSSRLALPSVAWGTGWVELTLLTGLCVVLGLVGQRLLARRASGVACCTVLALVVLLPMPTPGWPPRGWVLAVCDVGQGDALAIRTGEGSAVVVDAGPDPDLVDRCLDRLDVAVVPLVLLSHFHADHVDGLPGVYDGRRVEAVDVTALAEPAARADAVHRAAGGGLRVPSYAETRRIGDLTLQVLGPVPGVTHHGDAADDGSGPNNASLVLLAEVRGVTMLLTGDVEPPAQAVLARSLPGLRVDVLKIPHHGSRHQDLDFLTGLQARVAIASAGEDNDYGHPAAATLDPLSEAGARVFRTDRDGDVVVVVDGDNLAVRTRE